MIAVIAVCVGGLAPPAASAEATDTPQGYRAFVAAPGAAPSLLPHPAGITQNQDIATAINERGDIAGFSVDGDTHRLNPVVWRGRAHRPALLPAPNEHYHSVAGINEQGTVVGTRETSGGYRTVIWTGRDHHEVAISEPGIMGWAINHFTVTYAALDPFPARGTPTPTSQGAERIPS